MSSRAGALAATFTPPKVAVTAALVVVAGLVPVVYPSQYGLGVLVTMLIIIVLNSAWNFLLGFAGVWNFGQLAIYAAGGYGAGLLVLHASVPPWLALPAGGVAGMVFAAALAFPTLRLYGIYTSLLTFAAAVVLQLAIQNDDTGVTGGTFGLPSVEGLFDSLSPLGALRAYYWVALALVVVTVAGLALLVRSPLGLALRTLRDSLPYGSARGISPLRHRVLAFAISGFISGVAGALYTVFNGSIGPSVMGLTPMSIYVTMIVVGGLGTITGPIIGTMVVTAIQQALVDHPGTQLTVLGTILLIIVVFFPRGIADELGRRARRLDALLYEDEDEDEEDAEVAEAQPPAEPARAGTPQER